MMAAAVEGEAAGLGADAAVVMEAGVAGAPNESFDDVAAPRTFGAVSVEKGEERKDLLWREERRARRRKARQERMNEKQRRCGLLLAVVSGFDILISGFMTCVAFAHGYLDNGVSLYCLGIQAFSHGLSSLLLALRFWDEYWCPEDTPAGPEDGLLKQRRRVYLAREKFMSFLMGFVMLVSAMALLLKAFRKWIYWDRWYADHVDMDHDAEFATTFLAWYGFVVYSGQAGVRAWVASVMKRTVVWFSVGCSVVSLAYLFVIGVAALLEDEWSWKAEPIAATVLAAFTVAEGFRLIYTHRGDIDAKLEFDPWA
eukprot:TRINITY_DN74323_c0_g1_i1.p1 TRINITY_DN74323_c0_g1~~TRINITY_DN74323_c0_g1_i1.p1  ORF type:complete len:328 (-),score=70.97 TRINITY_DN74323_c0_g1_i1:339-1274(-)